MTSWLGITEITRTYIVGEATLLRYSKRGNLPLRRDEVGCFLFDESTVASLFVRRDAVASADPRILPAALARVAVALELLRAPLDAMLRQVGSSASFYYRVA